MATSYGYGGEFSSDEDIDRIEKQSERLVQSKFDSFAPAKPTKSQIEDTIEAIKRMPIEQDVQLSDEQIAGILDYHKTQRGPIVDSTRNLYKKIVLRLIRGNNTDIANQETQGNGTNHGAKDASAVINNNNIIIKNSVNNNNYTVRKPIQHPAESFSSDDDDEPMVPVNDGLQKRVQPNVKNTNVDQPEPMDIDPELNAGQVRETKQVDITDDESDEEDKESSDSDDDEEDNEEDAKEVDKSLDSDKIDVTPIKPTSHVLGQTPKATSTPLASARQKQAAKGSQSTAAKKPYTRSQRMAAARASEQSTSSKNDENKPEVETQNVNSTSSSRGRVRLLIGSLLVVVIAFLIFYFRSNVVKTTDRLLSRKITF